MAGEVRWMEVTRFWKACSNWQDVSWDQKAMELFLGIEVSEIAGCHKTWFLCGEQAARRLELITGPNYRAIIKAYLIQQGVE